ncbi:Uu.00g091590.m01.CDS01 [Anthostomella pinea]|uniref:Uu.00g091590.m01.CDS01 n=1 Tax=Anthostomella pinea TaxID=933095 RepID=A0AAI8VHN4_9PEZI|nr:Uu.00g091590.m01.CDS01 [Anthostomella pinea]
MRSYVWPALAVLAAVLVNASTLTPPVLPLIVRNPYLSIWLAHARDMPWDSWPMFWTGSTVGFAVMASVPETHTVYPLLGRSHDSLKKGDDRYKVAFPQYHGATFDASTTNLSYTIDGTDLKITLSFLSPITPTSTFRQSLPAAYLTCHVEGSIDVGLYIDVNGEWASGNRDSQIQWQLEQAEASEASAPRLKTWSIARREEQLLTEFEDHAEWGNVHFSAPHDVEHQSGEAQRIRRLFAESGSLDNQVDDYYRGIFEEEPVFAFSKTFKLGDNSGATASVSKDSMVLTFALTQDPVVQFASARGLTMMRPLWSSFFFSAQEMLQYHYDDYKTATSLAQDYSDQLGKDAYASGSQDYQDIAALSARQVLGATQFSGTPENPILFLKEISSNGNFQTVDVIFPAFPFFLYTNPQWLVHLLEPLLEHQLSGQYPNDYSMHDLGTHFPNATGHNDGKDEYMPVEECGDMLIMGLALVNALKDNTQPAFARTAPPETLALELAVAGRWQSVDAYGMDRTWEDLGTTGEKAAVKWVSRSYKLWKKWTGYLVRESLIPANQLSTDDFAGWLANQTNLALKGIIGIKAMSGIAELAGEETESEWYSNIADEYIEKWQGFGLSRDRTHAKLAYTWYGSWTTIYNLFADALLCFHMPAQNTSSLSASRIGSSGQTPIGIQAKDTRKPKSFIPDDIYQIHSDWYHAVMQRYGLPLDSRHLYTKSDWEFFAAAVASKKVRTEILQHVAAWVNETVTDRPLTDLYETEGQGEFPSGLAFTARPVVGGHFAFLALERACGGKAAEGLKFLELSEPAVIDVEQALTADMVDNQAEVAGEL